MSLIDPPSLSRSQGDARYTRLGPNSKISTRNDRLAVPRQPLRRRLIATNPTMGNGTTRGAAGFGSNTRVVPSALLDGSVTPPAARNVSGHSFSYAGGGSIVEGAGAAPAFVFVAPTSVTTSGTSTFGQRGFSVHTIFTGSEFGVYLSGNGGKFALKINDEYLVTNSATVAAVSAGGSGYVVGDLITLANGVQIVVQSVTTGAVTAAAVVLPGSVATPPANPAAQVSTNGVGISATFNLTWRTDVLYTDCPNDGQARYYRFDTGVRDTYRIDLKLYNTGFAGMVVNANDTLTAAPIRGPRCICVGDSFTDGTGASALTLNNWVAWFADYMGWDDVWSSGIGGTGYTATNAGANCTFADRVQHDVIQYSPEIVITLGGFNDKAGVPATVAAAAQTYYSALRTGLPDAILIASTNSNMGVNGITLTANYLDIKSRLQTIVAGVSGLFLDLQEIPLTGTANTATLKTSGITASLPGSTTVQLDAAIPVGATVQVDNERMQCLTCTGGATTFNTTWDGTWRDVHAIGATFTQVGGSLWGGAGSQVSPRTFGNCTALVSNDTVHPANEGHRVIGYTKAALLISTLGPN